MLYLEDFLELIDQLPLELRDRFTEMRTLDLQVQNGQDKIGRCIDGFFNIAPSLPPDERQRRFDFIKSEYAAIMEHADEKIGLANTMYDLVERYQRKLEEEAAKFRLELEADSPGITAVLEAKVQDSEASNRQHRQDRKRLHKRRHQATTPDAPPDRLPPPHSFHPSPRRASDVRSLHPQASVPSGSGGIAAALTGRRDTFAAMPSSPFAGPSGPPKAGEFMHTFAGEASRHGRPRKLTSRVQEMIKESMEKRKDGGGSGGFSMGPPPLPDDGDGDGETDARRWCICNQTSYGEMVACDSPACVFEWFHYECVGITAPPKGRWFCPHCTETLKRRKAELQPPTA